MTNVERTIKQARHLCLKHGSTLTPKRQTLLQCLLHSKRALSAYDIIDVYRQQFGQSIPAVSVYRMLDFFQRIHVIHRIHSINKFILCSEILNRDISSEGVIFLVCRTCHEVKEQHVSLAVIQSIKNEIQDESFHLVCPQVELECLCQKCRTRSPNNA